MKNRPIGPAHPNYQGKGRSKSLPTRLHDSYMAAINDPKLMEFHEDVATLTVRANELLESGESLLLWKSAQTAFDDLADALHSDADPKVLSQKLDVLSGYLRRGMADTLRWHEFYQVTKQITNTKAREHKRMVDMKMVYTAEQVLAYIGYVVNVASTTISNKDDLKRFAAAIDRDRAGFIESRSLADH
ncbi:MAG: hypothetical protein MOB07_31560 [Acidobacteria bacterium]|nr:hypothetical protein [Acidobacteriota bacterium]